METQKQASPVGLQEQQQIAEVQQKMFQIMATMKEFSEAQSPVSSKYTDDSSIITRVEFIPEGGIFTYLLRYEKPFRGFPLNEIVQQMDEFKKVAKIVVQKAYSEYKEASLWRKVKLFFSIDMLKTMALGYLHAYHWQIKRYRLKPHMYCKAVREVHTILSNHCRDIFPDDELREAIRDSLCMFLEFDNAYRFRFQDIIMELDKKAMSNDPIGELQRLFQVMIDREVHEAGKVKMADKWKMAKELMTLFLKTNKPILYKIQQFFLRIDKSQIELTEEDRYYCEFRKDYDFGFMTKGAIPKREVPKGLPFSQDSPIQASLKVGENFK